MKHCFCVELHTKKALVDYSLDHRRKLMGTGEVLHKSFGLCVSAVQEAHADFITDAHSLRPLLLLQAIEQLQRQPSLA